MPLRKPPALDSDALVGVVSPAAAVWPDKLEQGCDALRRSGFTVRVGAQAYQRHRFLAGPDGDRVAELTAMFRDPEVAAVFCSRAGYGSGRLLPALDFAELARHPKIFMGYSDVTLLLNALVQRAEMLCFHGPLVAGEFAAGLSDRARRHLFGLLTHGMGEPAVGFPTVLRGGIAEGPLLGGCLSVLVATLGTPFALDPRGAILFLEDTSEKPYRIDRMLTQLKQAGLLERLAGVVFGEMPGCWGEGDDPMPLLSVIADAFADFPYPIGLGLPAGHGGENLALPLGARVRLDTERKEVRFLESAVT